ncbi:hypothetical protein BZM27_54860, partial [Paraburkholderia steynii]
MLTHGCIKKMQKADMTEVDRTNRARIAFGEIRLRKKHARKIDRDVADANLSWFSHLESAHIDEVKME